MPPASPRFNQREMLRLLAAAGPARLFGQTATLAAKSAALITVFLEALRKSDGAYGCGGHERSHLTWRIGVIWAYHLLKIAPPNRDTLGGDRRSARDRDEIGNRALPPVRKPLLINAA